MDGRHAAHDLGLALVGLGLQGQREQRRPKVGAQAHVRPCSEPLSATSAPCCLYSPRARPRRADWGRAGRYFRHFSRPA